MSTILKQATVTESASKVIATKYGDRQVLTVNYDNQDEKIWFNPGSEYAKLKVGESVGLLIDNGKKKLIISEESVSVKTTPLNQKEKTMKFISKEKRKDISEYIDENIDLYIYAFKQVQNRAVNENINLTPEDTRTIATTMYLSAQRKFNLV